MNIKIEHGLILLAVLALCYLIFYKKETFINKKLENFNGDDLNIHMDDDLNVVDNKEEEQNTQNIIE